jgi:hypothetical protein
MVAALTSKNLKHIGYSRSDMRNFFSHLDPRSKILSLEESIFEYISSIWQRVEVLLCFSQRLTSLCWEVFKCVHLSPQRVVQKIMLYEKAYAFSHPTILVTYASSHQISLSGKNLGQYFRLRLATSPIG